MRILNIDPDNYSPNARSIYRELGKYEERSLTRRQLLDEIKMCDVLVLRYSHNIDREIISRAEKMKIIATNLTGTDHIDLLAASERGIRVVSLREYRTFLRTIHASAEHTWALLLALMRRIPAVSRSVLDGNWDRNRHMGTELNGKTLGILGLGRNGVKIAGYGSAFGMEVCGYDPYAADLPEGLLLFDEMEAVLERSDVVSVHVPLNSRTRGMMNRTKFDRMRQGAVIVNTSRGDILDESALIEALKTGHLSGAALDVVSGELAPGALTGNPLVEYARTHDNLIITPHVGGVTRESWEKTEKFIAERVRDFVKNGLFSALPK